MARRLEPETPYTPLDDSLVAAVLRPTPAAPTPEALPSRKKPANAIARTDSRRPHTDTVVLPSRSPASNIDKPATSEKLLSVAAERMNATLRLKVSSREKREFEAFVARLGALLDTTLKPSNILRVMLTVAQHAEGSLSETARRLAPLRRPPNDDAMAYAEFEHRLVRLIDAAIRNSTPLK